MRIAIGLAVLSVALSAADAEAATKPRLKAFASCKDLVSYARAGALRTQGGVGVLGRAVAPPPQVISTPPLLPPSSDRGLAPTAAMPVSAEGGAAPDFSGTNVQEAGVDEPDTVKTDGKRIFAVTDRTLRIVDVASRVVTGSLALDGFDHRLLLRGNRVLVISSKGAPADTPVMGRPIAPTVAPLTSTTIVTEVDVAETPKVTRTMEVPGRFVDARQNGATARLVIDAVPAPIVVPADGTVQEGVKGAGLSRFLGRTVLRSKLSGKTFRRNLAPCDAVTRPAQFSGLDVLAILTIDLDRGMYSLDRDGVMAGAQVVYGSTDSLYVASRRYVPALELGTDVPQGMRTEIHRFDIADPAHTVYRATGTVPGFILNNYALSEYKGALRVASTEEPPWIPGGTQSQSQSRITVLRQDGARLAQVGSVGGLGAGERIYAVRFMGERGYVVTFRQVDPLYTLDLSTETAPKVVGELKIPGYSAYLHPVGENLVLGVGREGTGVQASLFDVSDFAAPKRVAQLVFGSGATAVETEPHAFLYWPAANLAVMPLQTYNDPPFTGAVGMRIGPAALTEAGRVVHHSAARGDDAQIERSLVIGDKLYTLSWLGLASSGLNDLAPAGFTAF
jgi:uncharacterized secreted protein with C-terminal beta-propeller domain